MRTEAANSFTLGDLAVFDTAHLRQVIGTASGAIAPSLVGRAFAGDELTASSPYAALAQRIERALPPDDGAAFGRARRQPTMADARAAARCALLDQLFWELIYWRTPDEYERLTAGEQVHLGALDVARVDGAVVLDAGAGTGRLTLPLARRARRVYAMDAAPPMLRLLERKVAAADLGNVELVRGAFRRVPLPDASVDAVIACSAFGTTEARGGACGLDELRRVTRPGGRIVIMWPEDPAWFVRHGFTHAVLPGHLTITFPSREVAWHAATRFYGAAALRHLASTRRAELPYHVLGIKPPRDLCWLAVRG
ncbi:MAG TPA: class I SAM-dependent methyltransferase [Ktedonobacterales bacterium]|nr:class I SAM-dependent methyltransferase [Ktedonobacterales bacterium]